MVYIFEGGSVVFDGSTITEEERNKAIVVTENPTQEYRAGKIAVLKWDVSTQTAWYEYEDAPNDNELEELKQQITDINIALAEIMGV